MPQTFSQNTVHVVFSTKDRAPSIPSDFQPKLWAYLAGVCRSLGIIPHAVGGMENHVHLLMQIPVTIAVSKAVSSIKSNSSRWVNEERKNFSWQRGYGAFSVNHSTIPAVIRYIQNQKIHHRKMSFETEFVEFLKKHEIEFDAKYVFD
jgi:putative transposase